MEKETRIRIKAIGDICPGDASIEGFGVLAMTKREGAFSPFRQLGDMFNGTELLIGNLEGTLSSVSRHRNLRMCGLPEFANALRRAGFNIVSVANNHVYDHGPATFEETVYHLEKAGLKICGLRDTREYYCKPVFITQNSLNIGILAYNWVGLEDREGIENHIAVIRDGVVNYTWNRTPKKDKEARDKITEKNINVIGDIKKLREEVDIVILLPHWGYEWTIYPPFGVVLEARCFVEAGADIILGCHSHVPQGVERYKNGVIFYSLGNFLFDMCSTRFRNGMIADILISNKEMKKFAYHFTTINEFFQPMPASRDEGGVMKSLIEKSSSVISAPDAEAELDDEVIYKEYERQYKALKLDKIEYLFFSVFRRPGLIKPILLKTANLIHLLFLRALGKRIRW